MFELIDINARNGKNGQDFGQQEQLLHPVCSRYAISDVYNYFERLS